MHVSSTHHRRSVLTAAAVQALEPRRLMAATPSAPRSNTLSWLDKGERQVLVDRLTGIPNATRDDLAGDIPASGTSFGNFDNGLKDYFLDRPNRFFFDPEEVASRASFITANIDIASPVAAANRMVDSHFFPNGSGDGTFSVDLPNDLNFRVPGVDENVYAEFKHNLNRFDWWHTLTDVARTQSSNGGFVEEFRYQLARWADQNRDPSVAPSEWSDLDKQGWRYDTSVRTESMVWGYHKMVAAGGVTAADHTLLLYVLMQHGDYLYAQAQGATADNDVDGNRTLQLAKSLHLLGQTFPEFDNAAEWEALGRDLLHATFDGQFYADGSHLEQTPGYQAGVMTDVNEAYWLDRLNNGEAAWSADRVQRMRNAFNAYAQMLSPNSDRPGIGDSTRTSQAGLFLPTNLMLGEIATQQTTLAANHATTDTLLAVADQSKFDVNDYVSVATKRELMRVTDDNPQPGYIRVERALGGSTAYNFASGATIYALGDVAVAKPRVRDAWLFGAATLQPFAALPVNPEGILGNRGKAFAMPDSGNLVLRSDGEDANAAQLHFDAGPKGGAHGHYDPLGIELVSGKRALVPDPGPYKYNSSDERKYVISTRAHNTVSVNDLNVGELNDPDGTGALRNNAVRFSYDLTAPNEARASGTHWGYAHVEGRPVVSRSLWHNYDGTTVLVDFVEATKSVTSKVSFNLEAAGDIAGFNDSVKNARTRYTSGDNVKITPLNGGDFTKNSLTFVTGEDADGKSDAYRVTSKKVGTYNVFVTMLQTYTGTSAPGVTASVSGGAAPGQSVGVTLNGGGFSNKSLSFTAPAIERPTDSTVAPYTNGSDVAYDAAGNLHMVWQDAADTHLKYSVRDATTEKWMPTQTVDASGDFVGGMPDLKFDNTGRPAIAYFDGGAGDLKYALLDSITNNWKVETVDFKKSVGLYPSLTFSRNGNAAMIAYYHRSLGDLRVAQQQSTGWAIETFADAGDQGRFPTIALDPNRPDLNARYVLAWDDGRGGKFARYSGSSWSVETIDEGMTQSGGYLSLGFLDTGSGTVGQAGANRYQPVATYYAPAPAVSLKYAERDRDGEWTTTWLEKPNAGRKVGLYNTLLVRDNRPDVFYFDLKKNQLKRMRRGTDGAWAGSVVDEAGGRDPHAALFNDSVVAVTSPGNPLNLFIFD